MDLASIKNFFVDLLFPMYCLSCGKEGNFLCQDCQATFELSSQRFCLCKKPVPVFQKGKCPRCYAHKLDGLYFALSYEDVRVQKLIQLFKYRPWLKGLARPLAELVTAYFSLLEPKPDFSSFCLIPLPLHKQKLRQRGYNQAMELAKIFKETLNLPLIDDCLVKVKKTLPQVELSSHQQRKNNVKGAFSVKNPEKIKNKKLLLIDDVYTTGATMEEAALVLKRAGSKEVWGVAVARG